MTSKVPTLAQLSKVFLREIDATLTRYRLTERQEDAILLIRDRVAYTETYTSADRNALFAIVKWSSRR